MNSPRLVHIPFSNSGRLTASNHLFRYRGQAFKLVQDARGKYADNLLAIVADDAEQHRAYEIAAEFFSALCWTNSCQVYFGMPSWHQPAPAVLRAAKPSMFEFPLLRPGGNVGGYSISSLVRIDTADQRLALAMYREALASNNDYLRFLFLWQILSVGEDPIAIANRLWSKNKDVLRRKDLTRALGELPLRGKSMGNYFDDDCRNAIGHISRKAGKTRLNFDSATDRARISVSVRAVKCFAELYIEQNLGLTERLSLYHMERRGIPEYHPQGSLVGKYVQPARVRIKVRKAIALQAMPAVALEDTVSASLSSDPINVPATPPFALPPSATPLSPE